MIEQTHDRLNRLDTLIDGLNLFHHLFSVSPAPPIAPLPEYSHSAGHDVDGQEAFAP
jgi:hypothetical protein